MRFQRYFGPIPRLFCALVVTLLVVGPGCINRRTTKTLPQEPGAPQAENAAMTEDGATDADAAELEDDRWLQELVTAVEDPGVYPDEWETVTPSPLDEIGDVTPDFEPSSELLDAPPRPTFDIPIEVNDKVRFWLNFYTKRHPKSTIRAMERSGQYLAMFQEIFEEEGLPRDLVYMAHVESAYRTNAYSRARALGIWQFIASTARHYDLRIDHWVDERRDPEKSARAAARYLKKLYGDFGDWYLAMAAYNAGEGRIRRAIRRTGKNDFWSIARTNQIRRETKNYVPAILAAIMISKDPEAYGLHYTPQPRLDYDTVQVEGAVDLQVLADCAGTEFETLHKLNPMLRRLQTPPHAVTDVRLPPGHGEMTLKALAEVPQEKRVLYVRHRVRPGDTLYDLARKYRVSVGAIQQANRMGRRTIIRAGKELVIPTVAAGKYAKQGAPARTAPVHIERGEVVRYRVRRGDSLSRIAQRHGTTASAIAAASNISVRKILQIGERLTVVRGARSAQEARSVLDGTSEASSSSAVASNSGSGVRHTVRRGDTLWEIASRYGTTVERLCSLNRISRRATLYPGTILTVAP